MDRSTQLTPREVIIINTELIKAKKHFISRHPLGHLTIAQLIRKASEEDLLIYGDKAQILQCFDQSKQMSKLFRINKLRNVRN